MKIETFTVSIACHKLVTREELAAALRKAAGDQGIYYVEVDDRKELAIRDKPSGAIMVPCSTTTKRRGRPPKAATAEAPSDAAPANPKPKPKRKYTRGTKSEEERGVPVTHRTCADGTVVETRGRCPGGGMP